MTLLFAGKKPSHSAGGGAKPKAYPPDAPRPNHQTKKIWKKKNKNVGGEKRKKNVVVIKDKSSELSMF